MEAGLDFSDDDCNENEKFDDENLDPWVFSICSSSDNLSDCDCDECTYDSSK